jgi:DNA invertase Pin-like site-specific DNA recombinase
MTATDASTAGRTAVNKSGRRALGVIRLSVAKDESTSPERQRELIEAKARARGSAVVAWAQDTDVSATKVHPFRRPELGPWLTERYHEFDEVIFWRIDRLARKVTDMGDMLKWARQHRKELVSATEPFDTDSAIGKAMVYLISVFAEMEADSISTRVTGSHQTLRKAGRWAGGAPPYGYQVIPNPDGPGFVLVHDPVTGPVVVEAVDRIINKGHVVNAITADFNRRGILPPREYVRQQVRLRNGEPEPQLGDGYKPPMWGQTSLHKILRSRALRGDVVHRPVIGRDAEDNEVRGKKVTITGPDGLNLARAVPLISESDWSRLQKALDGASRERKRQQSPSLLLGVGFCGRCGRPLYRWERTRNGRQDRYYVCRGKTKAAEVPDRCTASLIQLDELDGLAERHFLSVTGRAEVMDRVWIPGEDHSEELEQVKAAMGKVRDERDAGLYDYDGGDGEYQSRMARLVQRRKHLESLPQREPTWDYVATGKTFAQVWEASDIPARRSLMKDAGYGLRAVRDLNDRNRLTVLFRIDAALASRAAGAAEGRASDVPLPEREFWPYHLRTGPDGRQYWRVVIGEGVRFGQSEEDGDRQMAEWMAFEGQELTGKSHLPSVQN